MLIMGRVILLCMVLTSVYSQNTGLPCSSNPCLNGGTCFNGADSTSYICNCSIGYIGTSCEMSLQGQNPCSVSVCQNGGSCIPIGSDGYLCQCPDGFSGTTCQTETTVAEPCSNSPCLNGGSCLVSSSDSSLYICVCPSTHEGDNCEISLVNCASNPCNNGGTCFVPGDDSNFGFFCFCPVTHTGDTCDTPTPASMPCSSSPCFNNGMCLEIGQNYTCNCLAGFTGNRCETNIDECSSNPCVYGTCVDVFNGFYCECEAGWEGQTCNTESGTMINPCSSAPCQNDGSCLPSLDMSTFLCICSTGFAGDLCEMEEATGSPDFCNSFPCLNGGSCISSDLPGIDFAYCHCASGYVGQFCERQDGGACVNNICMNGGTCNPQPFAPGGFFCSCSTGFSGILCEVDDTTSNPCDSLPCTNGGICFAESDNSDYFCQCQIGYSGRYCESVGPCVSQPCQNGATCLEGAHNNNNYLCYCSPGYSGTNCSETVPEDACSLNPCMNEGQCMLTSDTPPPSSPYIHSGVDFWCDCPAGFAGTFCQSVDPCASSPCLNGGSCSHIFTFVGMPLSPDGFWCQCTAGFIGSVCSERGPCESNPCMNGGTCLIHAMLAYDPVYGGDFDSSMYSFICECAAGYTGETCSTVELPEDNPCSSSPCQNGGTCFASFGGSSASFFCQCPIEYVGDLCQDMGPCESSPCQNGGSCFPTVISPTFSLFYCLCPNYYSGDLCTDPVTDACSSSPCMNNGSCSVVPLSHSQATFMCSCQIGFTGQRCETPIANPCDSSPCLNEGLCFFEIREVSGGPAYSEMRSSYACQCPAGFTGEHCQVAISDACSSSPCQNLATCTAEGMTWFFCICPPEYTGVYCTEPHTPPVDACQEGPCQNESTCIVDETSVSGYICVCDDFHYGEHCQHEYGPPVSPCDESPCLNGGSCIIDVGFLYLCDCPAGYGGVNCEIDMTIDYCVYEGVSYVNGENREDSCNTCVCQNTEWSCTEYDCECTHGLDVYNNGDHRTEGCNTCVCSNGQWYCTEKACADQCLFMEEVYMQGDTRLQDCNTCTCIDSEWICSDLKCQEDCIDDEQKFDDCNECFCKDGQWVCTTKVCSDQETTNIRFKFPNDFNEIIGKEELFKRQLKENLAYEFYIPTSLIQNMQVSAGSILVDFNIAYQDGNQEFDLDILKLLEYSIESNSFTVTFEGKLFVADPESFKMEIKSNTDTEEDEEDKANLTIIAVAVGSTLLVFGIAAVAFACFCKRKEQLPHLKSFKEDMEGIPNNTLSFKVKEEPIHRVRTLPPGYKYNNNE